MEISITHDGEAKIYDDQSDVPIHVIDNTDPVYHFDYTIVSMSMLKQSFGIKAAYDNYGTYSKMLAYVFVNTKNIKTLYSISYRNHSFRAVQDPLCFSFLFCHRTNSETITKQLPARSNWLKLISVRRPSRKRDRGGWALPVNCRPTIVSSSCAMLNASQTYDHAHCPYSDNFQNTARARPEILITATMPEFLSSLSNGPFLPFSPSNSPPR